jgi:hypothetical protein
MVPFGGVDFHGASPGRARRCIRERVASGDLVRRGRFRAEASGVKDRSLCPLLMYGSKTAAHVRFSSGTEAKDEETSSNYDGQYREYRIGVW